MLRYYRPPLLLIHRYNKFEKKNMENELREGLKLKIERKNYYVGKLIFR